MVRPSWFDRRALLGALVLAPCALWTVLRPPPPAGPLAAALLDGLGWVAFLAGATMRFWATLHVGGRKATTLVDTGPYSVCRHPLYLGSLLLAASAVAFLRSEPLLLGLAAMIPLYGVAVIRDEEAGLRETLGRPYEDYRQRTPAILPRRALFRSPPTIEVHLHGLLLELRRAARWAWIPFATLAWRAWSGAGT